MTEMGLASRFGAPVDSEVAAGLVPQLTAFNVGTFTMAHGGQWFGTHPFMEPYMW